MRVVLIHGKDTNPKDKWYPWFVNQMQLLRINVLVPELPDASDPNIKDWLAKIDETAPDNNTIIIGHSRGGVAILRWLESATDKIKVKKVILVATNSGFVKKMDIPSESNHGFYTETGYNFKKIKGHCKNFVIIHSKDDPWVSFNAGNENAKGLSAKFIALNNYKHFGRGINSIPSLLEEIKSEL